MTAMTAQATRSPAGQRRAGTASLLRALRAEWVKFRSVRGWAAGMVVAMLVMLAVGLFAAGNANIACPGAPGQPVRTGPACLPRIPIGPGGEAVTDSFYFVHQPLTGNGSITVAVTSLTGRHFGGAAQAGQGPLAGLVPGAVGWAKAGILISQSAKQGAAYAAMMATGGHGARFQYDYVNDVPGRPGRPSPAAPLWLRLVRSGDTITGYDSAGGSHWARVGTATMPGLPQTVQAGLFVTSPLSTVTTASFGGSSGQSGPSQATAVFSHLAMPGASPGGWVGTNAGAGPASPGTGVGGFRRSGGTFTVTGSGDIAPAVPGAAGFPAATIEDHLVGAFAALIAVAVIGAMFITAEYRRGLIRTTLAASPRRGQVLAAKAIVVGSATFVLGLAASVILVVVGTRISRDQGEYVLPVSWLTQARVVAGTAALLAVGAVFALGVGAMLRRGAAAVATSIVGLVLTYVLGVAAVLPAPAAEWLLRVTPAAGFAIQQSIPAYPQVAGGYGPPVYFPLSPWAGFAVLCAWAAAALVGAYVLLRRRDA